ncbi:transcription repressor OFP2-like [Punica granatum]|uniref:Transcription repressor OFP2-like n=2 Tax=Punica granatum TaxID=22663 RepID=A0A6P8CZT5_PUNGR|nr:transcription repressor OFP2-like [Punica granatum]XP_031386888.1 transcription repressor OFP2-like [Punica granatum]PKI54671.1 hypothetical protein CRG98_024956 [Punica granatum]
MGNYKFRLSDMMPNAWFYKLKDMSRTRNPPKKMTTKTKTNNKKKTKTKTKTMKKCRSHGSHSSASAPASACSASPSRNSIHRFHPVAHAYSYSHSFYGVAPPKPTTAFEQLFHRYPVNSPPDDHDPPQTASRRRKSARKTVHRPSPNPRPQRLISAHWRRSVWTDDDLNSSPPDHYFASPAPPTDGSTDYDSSCPDLEGPNSSTSSDDELEVASSRSCSNCNCQIFSSSSPPPPPPPCATITDIIIDMNHEHSTSPPNRMKNPKDQDATPEPKLPPISTRRATPDDKSSTAAATLIRRASFKLEGFKRHDQPTRYIEVDEESVRPRTDQNFRGHIARKSTSGTSAGIKLRTNNASRAAAGRKMQAARARKSTSSSAIACSNFPNKNLTRSFAIAKLSVDPQGDFKDSMEEMITGHNIRASKDLEDLLACYLSLNPSQHRDYIIRAFEDIWFHILR